MCEQATNDELQVVRQSCDFRQAVALHTAAACRPGRGEVCVRNKYVGINATDVNVSRGRYFQVGDLPHSVGFEGMGEVVAVGEDVEEFRVGQAVAYVTTKTNAYAHFSCVAAEEVHAVPDVKKEYLPLLVSGLTASIGLEKAGRIAAGETVLVTAAAGGAGHLVVQWAKAAGCHVIGMCSSEEKEKLLKELHCDRVINYKKEDLKTVLEKEYPRGVDVVWETVGGEVFATCLSNMAVKGRLLVMGVMSRYRSEDSDVLLCTQDLSRLPATLLFKSAAAQGFFLFHYGEFFRAYFSRMLDDVIAGRMRTVVDDGTATRGAEFVGLSAVVDAVEHLHSGKSIGKVVVRIF